MHFQRLDRLVINQAFLGMVGHVELEHLARTGLTMPLYCYLLEIITHILENHSNF